MFQLTWLGSSLILMVVYTFIFVFILLCFEQPRKMLFAVVGAVFLLCGLKNNKQARNFLRRIDHKRETPHSDVWIFLLVGTMVTYFLHTS